MNDKTPAAAGRYKVVPYFNGGLFATVDPVELGVKQLNAIGDAASKNWSHGRSGACALATAATASTQHHEPTNLNAEPRTVKPEPKTIVPASTALPAA